MNNIPQKGKLKRWDDVKGFGFIASEEGRRDTFIHISALKMMSRRPLVGDVITYHLHTDANGKRRAINARIKGVTEVKLSPRRTKLKKQNYNSPISSILTVVSVIVIGFIAYKALIGHNESYEEIKASISSYAIEEVDAENYSCTGKVYCSEMASCDEAVFYLANCPGTKMDGDADGIPCERQWCGW